MSGFEVSSQPQAGDEEDSASGSGFEALVHMEELLKLESELLSGLNEYITAEKRRYEIIEGIC